ncbi:YARHG domain-containing protein [Neobacillus mesonae]|uniref:YARHG domain-containing protein n=1 Tax=Neobacillus mesonae TaxID=1193713 RepID=UPI00203D8843|nr:YARHG domain-containing protein [Neobacillus mesonae]MCM3568994.1 YARHG domain-containing protein [Neobacillus mesonae]
MSKFCTNCGKELNSTAAFCTGCGAKVETPRDSVPIDHQPGDNQRDIQPMERTVRKQYNRKKRKNAIIAIFSIIVLALVVFTAYSILNPAKESKREAAPVVSSSDKSKKAPAKTAEETPKETEDNSEKAVIKRYTEKLNALRIQGDLSVGEWKITKENDQLLLAANAIPSKNLARMFDLYDSGNMTPLKNWAKDVFYIAEDLSKETGADWEIKVGNNCVAEHPQTLSDSDLSFYSGSCGYSIPVLSGTSEDDLSLIIQTSVFEISSAEHGEYIISDSDNQRLTQRDIEPLTLEQLRLARNEIYARHGYIFKSKDLQDYFSKKPWYSQDASYNGTDLSEVEKANVELIQQREKELE